MATTQEDPQEEPQQEEEFTIPQAVRDAIGILSDEEEKFMKSITLVHDEDFPPGVYAFCPSDGTLTASPLSFSMLALAGRKQVLQLAKTMIEGRRKFLELQEKADKIAKAHLN